MDLAGKARRVGRGLKRMLEATEKVFDEDADDDGIAHRVGSFVSHIQRIASGEYSPSLHAFYDGLAASRQQQAQTLKTQWENALAVGYLNGPARVPALLGDEANTILRLSSSFAAQPFWFADKDTFWTGKRDAAGAIAELNTSWTGKTLFELAVQPAANAVHSALWRLFRACWVLCQNFLMLYKVEAQDPFFTFMQEIANATLVTADSLDLLCLHAINAEARRSSVVEKTIMPLIHLGVWPALDVVDQSMRQRQTLSNGLLAMLTVVAVGVQLARWTLPKLFAHLNKVQVKEAAAEDPTQDRAQRVRSDKWEGILVPSKAIKMYEKMYMHMQKLRESFTQVYDGWDLHAFNPPLKVDEHATIDEQTRGDFDLAQHSNASYRTDCPKFLLDFMGDVPRNWLLPMDAVLNRPYALIKEEYEHLAYALMLECTQAARSRVFVDSLRQKLADVSAKVGDPHEDAIEKERLLFDKAGGGSDLSKMVFDALVAQKSPKLYDEYMNDAKTALDNLVAHITNTIAPRLATYTGERLKRQWQQAHTKLQQLVHKVFAKTGQATANRMRYTKGGPLLPIWLRLAVVGELDMHDSLLYEFLKETKRSQLEVICNVKTGWFLGGISAIVSTQVNWITKAIGILSDSLTTDMFSNGKNFESTMTRFSEMYRTACESSDKLKDMSYTFENWISKIRSDPMETRPGQAQGPGMNPPKPTYTRALDDSAWIRKNNQASISANLASNLFYLTATSFFGHVVGTNVFMVYGSSYGALMQNTLGSPNEWTQEAKRTIGVAGKSTGFNVVSGATVTWLTLGLEFVAGAMAHLSEWSYQHLTTTRTMTDPWRPRMAALTISLQLGTLVAQGAVIGSLLTGAGVLSAGWLAAPIIGLPALAIVYAVGVKFYKEDNRDWTLWLPERLRTAVFTGQIATLLGTLYRAFSVTGNWGLARARRVWVDENKRTLSWFLQLAAGVAGWFADIVIKDFVGPVLYAAGAITSATIGILAAIYYGSGAAVAWILRTTVTGSRPERPAKRQKRSDIEEARPVNIPALPEDWYQQSDGEAVIHSSVDWGIRISRVMEPLSKIIADAATAPK